MRLFSCHVAALTFLLAAPGLFAGETTGPVIPMISGKLGDPIQLFNGKDIDGWVWVASVPKSNEPMGLPLKVEDVWTVKDGVLHLNGKSQVPRFTAGYLRGKGEFTNYVLTVEQRHLSKGNGGILLGITGPDVVWPRTVQVQGQFGDVGDLLNQGEFKMTTDAARTTVRPKNHDTLIRKIGPNSEKAMGEWNVVETTVDHGTITVKVNGVVQNVATDVEPLRGTIGLQSEGAEMEFRKIEVRPIVE